MKIIIFVFMILLINSCSSAPRSVTESSDETSNSVETLDDALSQDDASSQETPAQNNEGEQLERGRIDELASSPVFEDAVPPYRRIRSDRCSFSALVHERWQIQEPAAGTLVASYSSARITVHSTPAGLSLNEQYLHNRSEIRRQDPAAHIFIDNRDITFRDGYSAKLFVTQYKPQSNSQVLLARVLTIVSGGKAYMIRCEAPVSRFYFSEHSFNTFMRSFRPLER